MQQDALRFALCSLLLPTIVSAIRILKSSFSAFIRGVALNARAARLSSTLFNQVVQEYFNNLLQYDTA